MPYGQGNRYRDGTAGPTTGDPPPDARANLTQRNNTFAGAERRGPTTGKAVIAYHARRQALLVGVQEDGRAPGQTYASIRNLLTVAGFSDAVFLDGSDSPTLWHRGDCIVAPGADKNELMTVGLGLRTRNG